MKLFLRFWWRSYWFRSQDQYNLIEIKISQNRIWRKWLFCLHHKCKQLFVFCPKAYNYLKHLRTYRLDIFVQSLNICHSLHSCRPLKLGSTILLSTSKQRKCGATSRASWARKSAETLALTLANSFRNCCGVQTMKSLTVFLLHKPWFEHSSLTWALSSA